jgi:hypothetical protein
MRGSTMTPLEMTILIMSVTLLAGGIAMAVNG